ncbi:unnamed protein product [Amoebophrya sp. A25]|nr:unnamed protein product [Amoebophrya sp. A25]|eukprot:GSA25T00003922001.1
MVIDRGDGNNNRKRIRGTRGHYYPPSQRGYGDDEPPWGAQLAHILNTTDPLTLKQNLQEVEMASDGNCLFRSVSDQMYLRDDYHDVIRDKCLEYIRAERSYFKDFITEDFESYVQRRQQPGEWGDDVELQALGEIYDSAIEIYTPDGNLQKTFHEIRDQMPIPPRDFLFGSAGGGGLPEQQMALLGGGNQKMGAASSSSATGGFSSRNGAGGPCVAGGQGSSRQGRSLLNDDDEAEGNEENNYSNYQVANTALVPRIAVPAHQASGVASHPYSFATSSGGGASSSTSGSSANAHYYHAAPTSSTSHGDLPSSHGPLRNARTVIRLVYRGQSHYNSLRDLRLARLPQILLVRERYLAKLGWPQTGIQRTLVPGTLEDLLLDHPKMRPRNFLAATTGIIGGNKSSFSSPLNTMMNNTYPTSAGAPAGGALANTEGASSSASRAASDIQQQEEQDVVRESLRTLEEDEDRELREALALSVSELPFAAGPLSSCAPVASANKSGGASFATPGAASASSATTSDVLKMPLLARIDDEKSASSHSAQGGGGASSGAASFTTDDELLQQALLLSIQKDQTDQVGSTREQGVDEQAPKAATSSSSNPKNTPAVQPAPAPAAPAVELPEAVIQCVSLGVSLEAAWKAYSFTGDSVDQMILFLSSTGQL